MLSGQKVDIKREKMENFRRVYCVILQTLFWNHFKWHCLKLQFVLRVMINCNAAMKTLASEDALREKAAARRTIFSCNCG